MNIRCTLWKTDSCKSIQLICLFFPFRIFSLDVLCKSEQWMRPFPGQFSSSTSRKRNSRATITAFYKKSQVYMKRNIYSISVFWGNKRFFSVWIICQYISEPWESDYFLFTAEANGPSCALIVIAWGLNALAYTLFLLTFPITYWLFVHRYLSLSLPFVIAFVFVSVKSSFSLS